MIFKVGRLIFIMAKSSIRQSYPREDDSTLAKSVLFPKLNPPLSQPALQQAIERAFERAKKNKTGENFKVPDNPKELVDMCLKHIQERTDPVLGTSFYPKLDLNEIFEMDAIPHEMQRQRMKIGVFYQYLLIELMRAAINSGKSNIIQAFDGAREGDAVVDIKTPTFDKNLRLYISVKKSSDTVGGQDISGVIRRLEGVVKAEKNLTSPYLCVIAIATPTRGKVYDYEKSRSVKNNLDGHPYSENCEVWGPGFLYPFITGRSPLEIYKESLKYAEKHMPFYSLKFRKECADLLKTAFIKMGIADGKGIINPERFFDFVAQETKVKTQP